MEGVQPVKPLRAITATGSQTSQWVYSSPIIRIGAFRCPAGHPAWKSENCIDSGPIIVFPRVPVRIKHAGKPALIADANCVMLYNAGQPYTRALLDPRGDVCEFFSISQALLLEILSAFAPHTADNPERPFEAASGPSDSQIYLAQRRLFEYVAADDQPDRLRVDELALHVIHETLAAVYHRTTTDKSPRRRDTVRCHRDAAEAAKEVLVDTYRTNLNLSEVAERVHLSPFHLCRVFRRVTGRSLHQYLTQLRLRRSLEILADRPSDLTRVALDLGFSSHAHFTSTFRSAFGVSPAAFREHSGKTLLN